MRDLRIAVIAAIVITVVFGLAYPLAMTGAAQVLFPAKADGDPTLIGKDYSKDDSLFQSRPVRRRIQRESDVLQQPGPEPAGTGGPAQGLPEGLPQA